MAFKQALFLMKQTCAVLKTFQRERNSGCFELLIMVSFFIMICAVPPVNAARIPSVVGSSQADAERQIITAGLMVGAVTLSTSLTVAPGIVMSQHPPEFIRVESGTPVDLVVSLGTAVPNIVGLTKIPAEAALRNAGLLVGTVTVAISTTIPIDRIISQNPSAASHVPPGSGVSFVVSQGAKVPDVVGRAKAAAQASIIAAGLKVGTMKLINNPSVPIDHIISQQPSAGGNVAPGSAVELVVSLGAAVPNVIGKMQTVAEDALRHAGLTVGTVTRANSVTVPINHVISQNPSAGKNLAPGSAVSLVVSRGTKVPDVVGRAKAAAQKTITAAGLRVGSITTVNSASVPIDQVISQQPSAGSNVAPGSAIALVVSRGTAVPDVVGSTLPSAKTAITTVGLMLGAVKTAASTTMPMGKIIRQMPAAGVNVSPGSAIDVVISFGPPAFLLGVQNDPVSGPLENSLYRIRIDGEVTKVGDLDHRTHGLAFVGPILYSLEELPLSRPAAQPSLYRLDPETGATWSKIPLTLSTGEPLAGGRGLATEPGTNQLWALLTVLSEVNTSRRLVTINTITGLATQITKLPGNSVDMAFDASGMLYVIMDNRPIPGESSILPARLYTVNKATGALTEFLDVSEGAVAGQPNFRESETIGMGGSPELLYHLSGQNKLTTCCTKNILFENIHLTTKARTSISLTGPEFFVTTALTLVPPDHSRILGDVDANGKADLVWRNVSDGNTAIWSMNGLEMAASGFPGGLPLVWQIAGVGDVNGDDNADLIWRHSTSGTVAVWLMNGLTITSVGFPGSASTDFQIAGVGDVNGDGKSDLIWRNTNDRTTAIWLMNGTEIASAGFPGGVSLAWQIAGAGDVNGDGKEDVIWRHSTSGTVAVWVMDGLAISAVRFPGSAPSEFQMAGVGDMNGDGKADLVFRHIDNGMTAIWLMNGGTIASTGFPAGMSLVWQIAQVGDVNGDGQTDIIWRHSTSGLVAVWLMNGVGISSVGFPGSAPIQWEIQR